MSTKLLKLVETEGKVKGAEKSCKQYKSLADVKTAPFI